MNQSEARLLHSGRSVHSAPAYLPDPLFDFSEGLVPRLLEGRVQISLRLSFTVKLNFKHTDFAPSSSFFIPRIVQALNQVLSAVHVYLRTAAVLQDCEGPGGGEESDH